MMRHGQALKKRLDNNAMIAFILNAVFLVLVILFCDMKYEVSDDFVVDAVLSGAYGSEYDPHLLFSNILLGYFLKFFYQMIPVVSWYFVFQILVCFLSLWAASYIVLEKNCRTVGILLSVLFVAFFSDDLYILVQFTKTAVVAAGAGGTLFLYGYWEKEEKKPLCVILGGMLALVGAMIRFQCIYIALAFLALTFLRSIWNCRKELQIKNLLYKALLGVLACGLLVGAAYGLRSVSTLIWHSDPDYAYYRTYNNWRANYTDTKSNGYEVIEDELTQLGLSETDFWMLQSWNFLDEDYFTEELVDEAADLKREYQETTSLKECLKQFRDREYQTYAVVWGIVILFFLLLFLHPKQVPWELVGLGVCACSLLYFFWEGRVVYRVEYSIYVCMAINLVTAFHKTEVGKTQQRVLIGLTALLCVLKIPLYIPDNSYQTMTQEEYDAYIYELLNPSGTYDIRKYRCNVNAREPYGDLTDYIESDTADTDHYYLLDFNTTIQQVYYNYKPWIRVPMGIWEEEYSYLGGVTSGFPGNTKAWEEHGIDTENPYKSLINDNIYVVDSKNSDIKLAYLQEQYYPNARKELVDTIDGMEIWKFYAE